MKTQLTFDQYQQSLKADRLMGLHCQSCKQVTLPPQRICAVCGGQELTVQEVTKKGGIKTFTVIRVASEGMTPPFIVALVETASGAWVMGNLLDLEPDHAGMDLIGKAVMISGQTVAGDLYAMGAIESPVFRLA